jgi:pimeloyl-ACP methyl ester carboxylesterase
MFLRQKDYTKVKGVMKESLKKILAEDLKPELSKIKADTLLLWGEKDKAVPLKDAYLMRESISQSILKIIPKASHTPNLEFPEKLAQIVAQFIKS